MLLSKKKKKNHEKLKYMAMIVSQHVFILSILMKIFRKSSKFTLENYLKKRLLLTDAFALTINKQRTSTSLCKTAFKNRYPRLLRL